MAAAMLPWTIAADYAIRWTDKVEVTGFGTTAFEAFTLPQWQRLLSVHAEQGSVIADINMPAISGVYRVGTNAIYFTPQFPFQAGIKYRAVFRPASLPGGSGLTLTSTHQIAAPEIPATTLVSAIHPAADEIPENILKFYILFSAPMSGGSIYDHIHLYDEKGREVELPFLEIDEELWDPGMTRLTLFLDPGRIKRGVKPLEEIGPSLEPGGAYALRIDRGWRDANGSPLQSNFEKKFKVKADDREPPDPAKWKITSPPSKSREPLTVVFDEPLDHALAQRMLRVFDTDRAQIAGSVKVDAQDQTWTFQPVDPWREGSYELAIPTIIEDLAGNNIGKPFDVDLSAGEKRMTNTIVRLPFSIR